MVCSRGDHVALLSRTVSALGLALTLAWSSSCANAPSGELTLEYGPEQGRSQQRTGWMFVSRDSSRFDDGTLLYGEFVPFAGGLGIIELDFSAERGARPVLRYQERRGADLTFEGEAVAGEIRLARDLDGEDCGCSTVEFALLFESGKKQRFIHTAHLGLSGGRCAEPVRLGERKGPVRIVSVDLCAPAPELTPPELTPPTTSPPSRPPKQDDYEDEADLCTSGDPYHPCEATVGCVASDDDSGCTSAEQEDSGGGCESDSDESSDSRQPSGCESDSSEAEGCGESEETSSQGCAEDDDTDEPTEADACEGDGTEARLGRLRRRRPPGAWSPQQSNAVTVACALIVPWVRGRGARRRAKKR